MSNVVAFPKGKFNTPPQSLEEIEANVTTVRKDHFHYLLNDLMTYIFGRLMHDEGIDLLKDENVKATSLMVEAAKAALYKSAGMEHKLHSVAEEYFDDDTIIQLIGDEELEFE
jgi:hypothetical protein